MNDPRYEIENEEIKQLILRLGRKLKQDMPTGFGFTLMVFSYNGPDFFYLSSAERSDMIKALREFIAKEEANSASQKRP